MNNIILLGDVYSMGLSLKYIKNSENMNIVEVWSNDESLFNRSVESIPIRKPHNQHQDIAKFVICNAKDNNYYNQLINMGIPSEKIANQRYLTAELCEAIILKYHKDEDKKEMLESIIENGLQVFNQDFTNKYYGKEYHIEYDPQHTMHFALWNSRKMYFPRSYTANSILLYLISIALEQDIESPHRYIDSSIKVNEGDTIIDAGAAEGFFTLDVIDIIKKAFLIEVDPEWVEALKITFLDYKDKIVIVEKFLTDKSSEGITLNDFLDEKIDLIKMDIEGAEVNALLGGDLLLTEQNPKILACSYHNVDDGEILELILKRYGYLTNFTNGYMFFPHGKKITPNLVKAVIRGWKPEVTTYPQILEIIEPDIIKKEQEYLYFLDPKDSTSSWKNVILNWIDTFQNKSNTELIVFYSEEDYNIIDELAILLEPITSQCSIYFYLGENCDAFTIFNYADYYITNKSEKNTFYTAMADKYNLEIISFDQ